MSDNINEEIEAMERQIAELEELNALNAAQQQATVREETPRNPPPTPAQVAPVEKNAAVFVGSLDPDVTEDELRLLFEPCGRITKLTLRKKHMATYAYITFESEAAAKKAILERNGQPLHSKPIVVEIKRDNIPAAQLRGRGAASGGMNFPGMASMPGRGRGGAPDMSADMYQMVGRAVMSMFHGGRGRGRGRGRGH